MLFSKTLFGISISALSFVGTIAVADVTPEQVWTNWRTHLEGYGLEVTAGTARSGSALSVSNISMKMDLPDNEGSMEFEMGPLTLEDKGNGTVAIVIPNAMPMTMKVRPTADDPFDMTITYSHTRLEILAAGSPEKIGYDISADQVAISLSDLLVDKDHLSNARMNVTARDVSGSAYSQLGGTRRSGTSISTGKMTYDIAVADPKGTGKLSMRGRAASTQTRHETAIPQNTDLEALSAALAAGFMLDTSVSYTDGRMDFSFVDGSESASSSSESATGSSSFVVNKDILELAVKTTNSAMETIGSDLPIPVKLAIAETAVSLLMPVAKTNDPKDFRLLVKLIGLAPDDMIWGMFDPGRALPRDPATLVVDLTGKANWLFDIFDPEAAGKLAGPPGEVHALTIKELQMDAAGAKLSGQGAFTFDNDDYLTFDGMPAPTGKADLKLVGGNGLIDKLVKMGIIGDEEAFGARAMMGVMARPGDGADTLVSTIEIKGDGSVSANGMRLK